MNMKKTAAGILAGLIENQYELGQSYYQRAQIYAALGDTEKQNADLAESLKHSN